MPVDPTSSLRAVPAPRPVVAVAAVAAAGLAVLGLRYAGIEGPSHIDLHIDEQIRQTFGPWRTELRRVVRAGGPLTVVVASIGLSLGCLALRRPRLAVVAFVGPILTGVLAQVLQPLIGRSLEGGFALPSGHTAGITAVATAAALIAVDRVRGPARPYAIAAASGGVAIVGATMAVSLVVNNFHVVSDTIAGFCTAVATVLGTALVQDVVAERLRARRRARHGVPQG